MRITKRFYIELRRRYGHGYDQRRLDARCGRFGLTLVKASITSGGIPATRYATELKILRFRKPVVALINGTPCVCRWVVAMPGVWHEVPQPDGVLHLTALRMGLVGSRMRHISPEGRANDRVCWPQ